MQNFSICLLGATVFYVVTTERPLCTSADKCGTLMVCAEMFCEMKLVIQRHCVFCDGSLGAVKKCLLSTSAYIYYRHLRIFLWPFTLYHHPTPARRAVNAGKSKRNEDNAHIHVGTLPGPGAGAGDAAGRSLQYYYFGLFDGHAGHGASTAAANQLHHILHVSASALHRQ